MTYVNAFEIVVNILVYKNIYIYSKLPMLMTQFNVSISYPYIPLTVSLRLKTYMIINKTTIKLSYLIHIFLFL